MLKKIFILITVLSLTSSVFAATEEDIAQEITIQNQVSNIGMNILNANKIDKRIIFTYSKEDKKLKGAPELTKRQIIVYDDTLKYAEYEDEVAALLSRKISDALKSFDGAWGGAVSAAQVKMAPKKYELVADKRAVDFMVKAGYNPLGLITFINKSCPQKRYDRFSNHNLTSKRLANIYEYIFTKYPYFLANNTYITNPAYQNFLLNSIKNRKLLESKIRSKSYDKVNYE